MTNGIDIDLGNFDTVKVDANSSTVTVGGSVKFGNITGPVYDAGKEIRMASSNDFSVLSLTKHQPSDLALALVFSELPLAAALGLSLGSRE